MPGRVITAQSINSMVRFHCPDDNLASRFSYLETMPDVQAWPDAVVDIRAHAVRECFYDFEAPYGGWPGSSFHVVACANKILDELLIAETEGCAIIQGASIVINHKRFVLVPTRGVGRTSFSLACLAAGLMVEGDEHIVVRPTDVVARPRTLRIREDMLARVPELREQIQGSPNIPDWNGNLIYAFAPRLPGGSWSVSPGNVDVFVFLVANHGGLTSAKALTVDDAFGRVLHNSYLPKKGRVAAFARLRMLVSGSKCIELRLGRPEAAIRHLRQVSLT